MMGIEPMTSSLPRKRSTPELHRLNKLKTNVICWLFIPKLFFHSLLFEVSFIQIRKTEQTVFLIQATY